MLSVIFFSIVPAVVVAEAVFIFLGVWKNDVFSLPVIFIVGGLAADIIGV